MLPTILSQTHHKLQPTDGGTDGRTDKQMTHKLLNIFISF